MLCGVDTVIMKTKDSTVPTRNFLHLVKVGMIILRKCEKMLMYIEYKSKSSVSIVILNDNLRSRWRFYRSRVFRVFRVQGSQDREANEAMHPRPPCTPRISIRGLIPVHPLSIH